MKHKKIIERPLIKVQGKWYVLLSMWGAKVNLSKLYDINNEVERAGIIWDMQPFYHQHEIWYSFAIKLWVKMVRYMISKFEKYIPLRYYVSRRYFEYCRANFLTPR